LTFYSFLHGWGIAYAYWKQGNSIHCMMAVAECEAKERIMLRNG